jgi:hypothetical protein
MFGSLVVALPTVHEEGSLVFYQSAHLICQERGQSRIGREAREREKVEKEKGEGLDVNMLKEMLAEL